METPKSGYGSMYVTRDQEHLDSMDIEWMPNLDFFYTNDTCLTCVKVTTACHQSSVTYQSSMTNLPAGLTWAN